MSPEILLVEDNDEDAELTIKTLEMANILNQFVRVLDGIEALDFLFARGRFSIRQGLSLPALVLLDMHLPRLDGHEVLAVLRGDERTRALPVLALTSSREDVDRLAEYQQYRNSFIRKPIDYDEFVVTAKQLGLHWMIVDAPPAV